MQSLLSTSNIFCQKKLFGFLKNDKVRLSSLALFLPLFLFVSLGFGQTNHQRHRIEAYLLPHSNTLLTQDSSSFTAQDAHAPLSDRHAYVNDSEEFENEDFFADASGKVDLKLFFALGNLFQSAFDLLSSAAPKYFSHQGNLPDQFSNKLYLLIQVFRI